MSNLSVVKTTIKRVIVQEPEGPRPGTFSLLCELSDGSYATPMGGEGFARHEDAEQAMGRIVFDGDALYVAQREN